MARPVIKQVPSVPSRHSVDTIICPWCSELYRPDQIGRGEVSCFVCAHDFRVLQCEDGWYRTESLK